MQLCYEDRIEMQRSMRKASIREIFITKRGAKIRVTTLVDSQSLAYFEVDASAVTLEDEIASWKNDHFEVMLGEVQCNPAGQPSETPAASHTTG